MTKSLQKVAVTGAAGHIAYSLLFRIAAGDLLGTDQPVALHLLDLPEAEGALKGVAMELHDCAFPLLKEVKYGSRPEELFEGIHYALLVGAKPRGPGMERKDLLADNGSIFVKQAQALNQYADPSVKVLVVGNPCNTNCLIAMHHAPNLNRRHFFAMTRLDQNRAMFQLAKKAGTTVAEISHMTIWGNHSSTQVPDFLHAQIKGRPAIEVIGDRQWLEHDFIQKVQKRGAEVIAARGKSSAASAAHAILETIRSLLLPMEVGEWHSVGVFSHRNPYGIADDLVFSFPCRTLKPGSWEIHPGLHMDSFLEQKIALTQKELIEERSLVSHLLT